MFSLHGPLKNEERSLFSSTNIFWMSDLWWNFIGHQTHEDKLVLHAFFKDLPIWWADEHLSIRRFCPECFHCLCKRMAHRGWSELTLLQNKGWVGVGGSRGRFDPTNHAIHWQAYSSFCAWEGACLRSAIVDMWGVASPAQLFFWELSPSSTWLPRESLFLHNPPLSYNWFRCVYE